METSRSLERLLAYLENRAGPEIGRDSCTYDREVLKQCGNIVCAYTPSIGRAYFRAPYDPLC